MNSTTPFQLRYTSSLIWRSYPNEIYTILEASITGIQAIGHHRLKLHWSFLTVMADTSTGMNYTESGNTSRCQESDPDITRNPEDTAPGSDLDSNLSNLHNNSHIVHSESTDQGVHLTGESSGVQAKLSTKEVIQEKVQQLVQGLNDKRKQDTDVMDHFKKNLQMHVEKASKAMEENLFQIYQRQSERIQVVLNELFTILNRIAAIENELSQFKQVMGNLYEQLNCSA